MTFEGVRGSSWRGDIAVDDVSITPGSCSGNPPTPPPPPTIPPSGTPDAYFKIVEINVIRMFFNRKVSRKCDISFAIAVKIRYGMHRLQ